MSAAGGGAGRAGGEGGAAAAAGGRGGALRELGWLFLRLGCTAFGGPAAHIAMMQDEVVRRRGWLSPQHFLDLVGAVQLLPGPNSTELAIHIGLERAGWRGFAVAGAAFILPAALATCALAWAYSRYGALPQGSAALGGVKPVIIAVVLQALVGLAPRALRSPALRAVGGASLAAALLGAHELAVLLVAGLAALAAAGGARPAAAVLAAGAPAAAAAGAGAAWGAALLPALAAQAAPALLSVFLVFLRIGSLLFGSGYVLLAFLRSELVERRGWLSELALLDAVAAGQLTPGPVFTTATFVGYLLGGAGGAAAATLGIFLPAFALVAASGPLLARLRRSPRARAFLDGVNAASLALMAAVCAQLARAALIDLASCAIAAASALLLLRWRVNSAWLLLAGAALGLALG